MDIKKMIAKLKRSRNNMLLDQSLSEEDRKLLMCLNLEEDIEQNIITLKKLVSGKNKNTPPLTDEQHYKLRLMEKTGTGSRQIH